MKCKVCSSFAINDHLHGREKGKDLDLCDVCYWRNKYSEAQQTVSMLWDFPDKNCSENADK